MATLLESLKNVDKSKDNQLRYQLSHICDDLSLGCIDNYHEERFEDRVKVYWVHKTYDDGEMSYGGLAAIYMDGKLIGLRYNQWAGDQPSFRFLSKEVYRNLRSWAILCVDVHTRLTQWLIPESQLNLELSETNYRE